MAEATEAYHGHAREEAVAAFAKSWCGYQQKDTNWDTSEIKLRVAASLKKRGRPTRGVSRMVAGRARNGLICRLNSHK